MLQEKYVQEADVSYQPKYMSKLAQPFVEGRGPTDVHIASNYTQKLKSQVEDSIYKSNNDPKQFAQAVEGIFQQNLLRKFNQIQYLKQEIALEQQKNAQKRKKLEDQK